MTAEIEVTQFIRPDIHIVAFDETHNWNIPIEYRDEIQRIECVYVFDKNRIVNCCEITPSYELNFWENRAVIDADCPMTDATKECIHEWVMEGNSCDEPVSYFHVSNVDSWIQKMVESGEQFRYRHFGDPFPELDEAEYRELFEDDNDTKFMRELIGSFNENHPL